MTFLPEYAQIAVYLGAALSIGIASLSAGIGEAAIAGECVAVIQRQPKSSDTIARTMIISQAITESGAVFGLVIALLLLFGGFVSPGVGWAKTVAILCAGIAAGASTIGPNLGCGFVGIQASRAIARTPKNTVQITTNMLIGQALAQTDAIFGLVVAFMLIYTVPNQTPDMTIYHMIYKPAAYLGSAFAVSLGTLGAGYGIGFVAGKTTEMLGKFPTQQANLMRTMFLGAAVAESNAIYALIISFLLIFI